MKDESSDEEGSPNSPSDKLSQRQKSNIQMLDCGEKLENKSQLSKQHSSLRLEIKRHVSNKLVNQEEEVKGSPPTKKVKLVVKKDKKDVNRSRSNPVICLTDQQRGEKQDSIVNDMKILGQISKSIPCPEVSSLASSSQSHSDEKHDRSDKELLKMKSKL